MSVQARPGNYLQRIAAQVHELRRLQESSPFWDQVVEEVRCRDIRIGGKWLADFASCNYPGFDLDPGDHRGYNALFA